MKSAGIFLFSAAVLVLVFTMVGRSLRQPGFYPAPSAVTQLEAQAIPAFSDTIADVLSSDISLDDTSDLPGAIQQGPQELLLPSDSIPPVPLGSPAGSGGIK